MKISKYIDKDWFRRWWKETWYLSLISVVFIIMGLVSSPWALIEYPTNYSAEDIESFSGTCYNVEVCEKKRVRRRGYYKYTLLHMSNGETYYIDQTYYRVINVSEFEDSLEGKNLTVQHELKKEKLGHQLLSIQDKDGNTYLNIDDIYKVNRQKYIMSIIAGIIFCFFGILNLVLFVLSDLYDHIRENFRREKRREHKKEKQLARQQRFLDDPDSFKKNKKEK